LFLIDGPTATGKTTIIDSITYALFSTLSGEESTKDRMRSDFSVGSDRSEIILDFSVNGVKHKITRGIPYSFAKAGGEGETKRAATQSMIRSDAGGAQDLALTQATEIGAYLVDLLHLNAAQFRQLVVLAQGEFAALLRMNPSKRLEALRDLLGDSYYQKLQTELDERAKAAQTKVNQARSATRDVTVQIQGLLIDTDPQELHDQVSELVDGTAPDPIAVTQTVIAHCELGVTDAQAALLRAREIAKPLVIQFNELTQTMEKLDEFVRARELASSAQSKLSPVEIELPLEEISVVITQTRERIGQLKPLVDWQLAQPGRSIEREALLAISEECAITLRHLREGIDTYPATSTQLKLAINEATQAATEVQQLEVHISVQKTLLETLEKLAQLKMLVAVQNQASQDQKTQLEVCEHDVTKAELTVSQAMRAQLTQRVAILAGELREGDPCAVCGSVTHPQPASVEMGVEVVSESKIELLEGELESVKATRDARKRDCAELRLESESTKLAVAALSATCAGRSQEVVIAELERLNRELVTQREAGEQLDARETELNELTLAYEENTVAIINAEKDRESASNEILKFDTGVNLKTAELSRLIETGRNVGDEVGELESKTERLITWREASSHLEKVSQSLTPQIRERNPTECENSFEELEVELTLAQGVVERAEERRTLSESLLKSATALVSKFLKDSRGVEKLAAEVKDSVGLGALVTATSSVNTKKLTLESYALQLRFAHVLESASLHLRKMSSGRLSFLLDESTQGRGNTGLGINVMDEATGDTRPTTSLSGGETFYASLSLALGLADVVQSETGGVSLETLFVDEGFGSLDTDTLERVLDQLDQLKSGGRTIGVISHVSEMKDRFPDRIVVSRGTEGVSQIMQG
jgi:exonuclease SbcC